jgi:Carbohydrate binding module (family 35)
MSVPDDLTREHPRVPPPEYVGLHGKPTLRERVGCLPMLAAILVTAVLIVGIVSALKPVKGGALNIFNPDPAVSATDDGNDPYAQNDDGNDPSGTPSTGPSSKQPGKKPTKRPPTPGSLPTTPIGAPPGTGTPSASPSPSPSKSASPSPAPNLPFTQEGERATLAGGAKPRTVAAASAGSVAGFVGKGGTVTFAGIVPPKAGTYTMTISYVSGATRTTDVSVNGGAATSMVLPTTADWATVATVTLRVNLQAGPNSIRFYNPTDWASDVDKITVR